MMGLLLGGLLPGLLLGGRVAGAAELSLCTWAAYTAPEVIERFTAETGHTIRVRAFADYPELDRWLADGHSGCDLALPADYQMSGLIRDRLIEPIDVYRLPGFANIDDAWRLRSFDPRNEYSIPFHWGTSAFVVDRAVVRGEIDSYRVLFEPPAEARGRVTLLHGATSTIQMALTHLGRPACSTAADDLAAVRALFLEHLQGTRFATIDDVVERLSDGRTAIGLAWNGDALRARLRRPTLRYAFPREGVQIWTDSVVVPRGAPQREAALALIAFLLRPEIAALQSNFTGYANAIRGSDAFMKPELLDAPEIAVPSSVRLDFQAFCDADTQRAQDRLLNQLEQELGAGVGK